MEKNTAGQKFKVFAFTTATGEALTGDAPQITGKISIDGGALTAITDTNPTELESGYYEFDATQAETNGKEILIIPVSSTAGVTVVGVPALIKTDTPNMSDLGIEAGGDITQVSTCTTNTDMRGTDNAALDATGAKEATVAALNNISAADVNAEVVDALNVDTYAEPGQGAPAATTSLAAKINYLYKAWRNKKTQTATEFSLYNDAGAVVDQKTTVSDDATTATVGEIVTGA